MLFQYRVLGPKIRLHPNLGDKGAELSAMLLMDVWILCVVEALFLSLSVVSLSERRQNQKQSNLI